MCMHVCVCVCVCQRARVCFLEIGSIDRVGERKERRKKDFENEESHRPLIAIANFTQHLCYSS